MTTFLCHQTGSRVVSDIPSPILGSLEYLHFPLRRLDHQVNLRPDATD